MRSYAPLGALCLLACASQKSAESHSDYTGKVDTVRTEGAERTVVVEEFELGGGVGRKPDGSDTYRGPADVPGAVRGSTSTGYVKPEYAGVVASPPFLLRRTTTTETGPITTTTKASADAHADAESASKSRFGPGVLGWMACAAGAVLALLLAWKFRAGLLGGVLKLIGR